MTPLLAVLDITDYVVIAVIAGVVTGFSALARGAGRQCGAIGTERA